VYNAGGWFPFSDRRVFLIWECRKKVMGVEAEFGCSGPSPLKWGK